MFHLLEASISLHSILIGLGFGLGELGGQETMILGLALCVHQFLEGLTVGMVGKRSGLGGGAWTCTYLVFTFSLPLGFCAGLVMRQLCDGVDDTEVFRWSSGLLNGMAAGTLTHIGVHMVVTQLPGQVVVPKLQGRSARDRNHAPTAPEACPHALMSAGAADADCCGSMEQEQALRTMLGHAEEEAGPMAAATAARWCTPSQGVPRMLAAMVGATLMAILAIWA